MHSWLLLSLVPAAVLAVNRGPLEDLPFCAQFQNSTCPTGQGCFDGKCSSNAIFYGEFRSGRLGDACRSSRDCGLNNCWNSLTQSEDFGFCGVYGAACAQDTDCFLHETGKAHCVANLCTDLTGNPFRDPAPSRFDIGVPTGDGSVNPNNPPKNCGVNSDCKKPGDVCYNNYCVRSGTRSGTGDPGDLCGLSRDCKHRNCFNFLTSKPENGNCGGQGGVCEFDFQCAGQGTSRCINKLCAQPGAAPINGTSGKNTDNGQYHPNPNYDDGSYHPPYGQNSKVASSLGAIGAAQDSSSTFVLSSEYRIFGIVGLVLLGANTVLAAGIIGLLLYMRRGGKRYFRVGQEMEK